MEKRKMHWIYFTIAVLLYFAAMIALLYCHSLQPIKSFLPLLLLVVMIVAGVNLHGILWASGRSTMPKPVKALLSVIATFGIFIGTGFLIGFMAVILKRLFLSA
jgi:hypothetical protein